MTDEKKLINWGKDCILVSRESTEAQDNAEAQQKDLQEYARKLGYVNMHPINTIESGFKDLESKEGWGQVVDYIKKHPSYRTIIITELSRLSRDRKILLGIEDYLETNKIQLIVKDLGLRLLTDYGDVDQGHDMMFTIFASIANNEMKNKKDRFQRKWKELRAKGYSIGGKVLFGYDTIEDEGHSKYVVNERQKQQILTIFKWYAYGINGDASSTSVRRIAIECKANPTTFDKYLFSKRNVSKCLHEEAYLGEKLTKNMKRNVDYYIHHKPNVRKYVEANEYRAVYPPIFEGEDIALYGIVQAKLSKCNTHNKKMSNNTLVDKSSKHKTILSKLLKCPSCGRYLIGNYRLVGSTNKSFYRCVTHKDPRRDEIVCNYKGSLSMTMLDSAIWAFAKNSVADIKNKLEYALSDSKVVEIENGIKNLNEEIKKFDAKIKAENVIFRANVSATPSDIDELTKQYNNNVKQIKRDKSSYLKKIEEKVNLLNLYKKKRDGLQTELSEDIERVENSKQEMYNYIHLLIKDIEPISISTKYVVLKIISFANTDALDFYNQDNEGLPRVKVGQKHDDTYYLFIDKSYTLDIKLRLVTDNQVIWNAEANCLHLEGDRDYTAKDIFAINLEETDASKFCGLQMNTKVLPYHKLTFYDEDFQK